MAEVILKAKFDVSEVGSDNLVYGWGMISHVDGEPYRDTDNEGGYDKVIVEATTNFMLKSRIANDSHGQDEENGIVIHSFPLTPDIAKSMGVESRIGGWMVGVKFDEATTQMYRDGTRRGFSVEGFGEVEDVEDI